MGARMSERLNNAAKKEVLKLEQKNTETKDPEKISKNKERIEYLSRQQFEAVFGKRN